MKTVFLRIFSFTLLFALFFSSASYAKFKVTEEWSVEKSKVNQYIEKKEDGDIIAYPRTEKVLVVLSLKANNNLAYEKRERKITDIKGFQHADGTNAINLTIETYFQTVCAPNEQQFGASPIGMPDATPKSTAQLPVAPGNYYLYINESKIGTIEVRTHDLTFTVDESYAVEVAALDEAIEQKLFANSVKDGASITNGKCSLETNDWNTFEYKFLKQEKTLEDGSVLITPESSGTATATESYTTLDCNRYDGESKQAFVTKKFDSEKQMEPNSPYNFYPFELDIKLTVDLESLNILKKELTYSTKKDQSSQAKECYFKL